MSDSITPTYDGPSCHTCYDLMPNSQFPRHDGKWDDYRGMDSFNFFVWLSEIQKSAVSGCFKCALLIAALERFEPTPFNIDDDCITIIGKIGKPLELVYEVNSDLRHVEIFCNNDLPTFEYIGSGRMIQSTMTPSLAAKMAKRWLDDCKGSHTACRPFSPSAEGSTKPTLPKRLIRVGGEGETPRLVESSGEEADYIALSYCWGRSQTLLTTKATLDARMREIPWDEIPATIRQAMEFTRELGVMYIWIDALCIIQDDHGDWMAEAIKMKDVYENALLTLSATSAPDTQAGCFFPRKNDNCFEIKAAEGCKMYARRPCYDTHRCLFAYGEDEDEFMEGYPAVMRGWTFQERLLSKRILYSAHDELVWECRGGTFCECRVKGSHAKRSGNAIMRYKQNSNLDVLQTKSGEGRDAQSANGISNFDAMDLWLDLVASYSKRAFTRYTDRIVALEGIAQKFMASGLGTYMSGMWSSFAIQQLAWLRQPSYTRSHESTGRIQNTPTWSWCSINQPCDFTDIKPPDKIKTRFSILDWTFDKNVNQHGQRLTVSAPSVAGTLLLKPNNFNVPAGSIITEAERNYSEAQMVFVTIPGSEDEYYIVSDITQWSQSSPIFSQMDPSEILHSGDEVLCVELYQTLNVDPENLDKCPVEAKYRFPWLVLSRCLSEPCASSGNHACYRRIGILDFASSRHRRMMEGRNPAPLIRRAEMRVFEIV